MSSVLASLGVKCYNNRQYIAQAVESALAQSYRPLEVVISDDGSTDGSWELIKSKVRAERRGEVTIVLNRNERNLGNCGNWDKICELSHGEWIFKFDGDDISDVTRVEKVMNRIRNSGLENCLVASCGAKLIDKRGVVLGRRGAPSLRNVVGAMMAFHRDCYSKFEKVEFPRAMDDVVWANRARMLGGSEVLLDESLVDYRLGTGVSGSFATTRAVIRRCNATALDEVAQARKDAKHIGKYDQWKDSFDERDAYTRHMDKLVNGGSLLEKCRAISFCSKHHSISGCAFLYLNLIPGRMGDWLIEVLSGIKRSFFR